MRYEGLREIRWGSGVAARAGLGWAGKLKKRDRFGQHRGGFEEDQQIAKLAVQGTAGRGIIRIERGRQAGRDRRFGSAQANEN